MKWTNYDEYVKKTWEDMTKKVLDRYGEDGINYVIDRVKTNRKEAIEILHNFGVQGLSPFATVEDIVDQWEDWVD